MTPLIRWPVWLWLLHLIVPAAGIAYFVSRSIYGTVPGPVTWSLALLCASWGCVALIVVVTEAGRAWLVRQRRQLFLGFASLVVSVVICDLTMTFMGVVPTIASLRRNSLIYRNSVATIGRLVPSQQVTATGRPRIDINGRGYRGPEVAIPKPIGTTRIVFLGGSQVFDPHGANWPVRVGEILSTAANPVDVLNTGVPGHSTVDSLGKTLTDLWMLEPDIFVLCQAWNDIKYFSQLDPERPYRDVIKPYVRDWRLEPRGLDGLLCYSSTYRAGRMRFLQAHPYLEGYKPRPLSGRISKLGIRQYEINVELLCDIATTLGVRVVLCKQARLSTESSPEQDRKRIGYNHVGLDHAALVAAFQVCDQIIEDVARRRNGAVLDMNAALSGKSELFVDHIHFSPAGSEEAARVVADRLAQPGSNALTRSRKQE